MKTVVGIDPGGSGALAAVREDFVVTFLVMPMLSSVGGADIDVDTIIEWLRVLKTDHDCKPLFICIEKVHAMPQQGTASMFTFGFRTGVLHGIAAALKIPRMLVTPSEWQKDILGGTNKKDKGRAIAWVKQRYPGMKIGSSERTDKPHSGVADAICIAYYGLRRI